MCRHVRNTCAVRLCLAIQLPFFAERLLALDGSRSGPLYSALVSGQGGGAWKQPGRPGSFVLSLSWGPRASGSTFTRSRGKNMHLSRQGAPRSRSGRASPAARGATQRFSHPPTQPPSHCGVLPPALRTTDGPGALPPRLPAARRQPRVGPGREGPRRWGRGA